MRRLTLGTVLLYAALTVTALLWLAPLFWTVSTSFKPEADILTSVALIPEHPTLEHYARVIQKAQVGRWFLNSAIVTLITTSLVLAVDAMAGYAFARIQFPGRNVLFVLVISTMMVPQQVLLVPLYVLLVKLGLLNTYAGLAFPRVGLALGVFLLRQFFMGLPKELDEAARLDGCSRWGMFWRISLPLARPAMAALAIFTFLGSWNDFLWPLVATTKERMFTLTVGLANFAGTFQTEYGALMAAACMASLPMLVVFLLLQRQFVQGITLTGIKG